MVRKKGEGAPAVAGAARAGVRPADVAGLLDDVAALLDEGRPDKALARVGPTAGRSPWLANAAAVCLLRRGDAPGALAVLRPLVLSGNGLTLRDDVPAVFLVNFAEALIADGNIGGGLRTLDGIGDADDPAVRDAREAVRRWHGAMTAWQRVCWLLGGWPPGPLTLNDPPGRLG